MDSSVRDLLVALLLESFEDDVAVVYDEAAQGTAEGGEDLGSS